MNKIAASISESKVNTEKRFENLEKSYPEVVKQNAENVKKMNKMNDSANNILC